MIIGSEIEMKNEKLSIHFIQLEGLNEIMIEYLNENLKKVCKGENYENEIKFVKIQLKKFFKNKDENKIHGSLGELFAHLYLNSIDFQPKFMFLNLEENSLKKGFDGFFYKDDKIWLLDSKSGKYDTQNISHRGKILEAFRSLKSQVKGETSNNPWENAYSHANSRDINSTQTLLKAIRGFSNDYELEEYIELKNQNIILASTIYWYDTWDEKEFTELLSQLDKIENNIEYSNLVIFCSNQKSYKDFFDYLEEEENATVGKASTNVS
ncbi:hypothetical protein ACVNNN_17390 [Lysinibacillus fusiformis]|uniref:hypothetical protein n=1 Tax=Lysinibacillus sp. PWR01 TaxID=3342384 RepID=UPI00372D5D2A